MVRAQGGGSAVSGFRIEEPARSMSRRESRTVTIRTRVLFLFVLASTAAGLCWWTPSPGRPVGRAVRPNLCGIWLSTLQHGTRRALELSTDGTFVSTYTLNAGPRYRHTRHSGTWRADSELVVLLIDADLRGPIKLQDRWRRYLPIMPDGRLRGVWWRPETPKLEMYRMTPGLSAPHEPR